MVARRVPKEVQQIFDKYVKNNVRNLHREEAVTMLQNEFGISHEDADQLFSTFDKDLNGVMSIWEFQHFYTTVGRGASAMVEKFKEMDTDRSGKLDVDEARRGLKSMIIGGSPLQDKEIDFFLKSSMVMGDDHQIDLGHFGNLLFQLKMYDKKKSGKK